MEIGHKPLIWNDTLMVGVELIDDQHQILVDMLNELNNKLSENIGRAVLQNIVHDLMSYAVYHFDTEEEIMLENQYPAKDFQAHLHEHGEFAKKVAGLNQDLQQGKMISREDLLAFLNGWLVKHILEIDMQIGKFMKEKTSQYY
jgi:hemerythrin-like metal-binding protein